MNNLPQQFSQLVATAPFSPIGQALQEMILIRYFAREVVILNSENAPILHHEYPVFPGCGGPFNGNPNWSTKIIELLQGLIQANETPAHVYFKGLRNEFSIIRNSIKKFSEQQRLEYEITNSYIAPDFEQYRLEMEVKYSRFDSAKMGELTGFTPEELAFYQKL